MTEFAEIIEQELQATQAALKQAVEALETEVAYRNGTWMSDIEGAKAAITAAQPHLPAQREGKPE